MKTLFQFGQFFNLFGTFVNRVFPKQESTNQNPTFALVPDRERLVKRGRKMCNGNNGEFLERSDSVGSIDRKSPPLTRRRSTPGSGILAVSYGPGFFHRSREADSLGICPPGW